MQHEKKDGYSLNQKRKAIFPKSVKGKAKNRRRLTGALIYGALFLLPWFNWGDHPAVFFNLDKRQLREVSNTYRFKITNKSDRDIDAQLVLKTEGFRLLKNKPLTLSAGESLEQEVIVMSMPKSVGSYDLAFEVVTVINSIYFVV